MWALCKSLLFQQDATTCACSTSKLSNLHATCADCRESSPVGGSSPVVKCQLKAEVSAQAILRPLHSCSSFLSSSVVTAVCPASAALLLPVVVTPSASCRIPLTHVQDMSQGVCC
jgi:hypothetical protein